MNCNFDELFCLALNEWPKIIDMSRFVYSKNEPSGYLIEGLGKIADEIGDRYIGCNEEIIFRNLHLTIFSILHECGRYLKYVNTDGLRKDIVKSKFDIRLRFVMDNKDLGYDENDISLARLYFLENA